MLPFLSNRNLYTSLQRYNLSWSVSAASDLFHRYNLYICFRSLSFHCFYCKLRCRCLPSTSHNRSYSRLLYWKCLLLPFLSNRNLYTSLQRYNLSWSVSAVSDLFHRYNLYTCFRSLSFHCFYCKLRCRYLPSSEHAAYALSSPSRLSLPSPYYRRWLPYTSLQRYNLSWSVSGAVHKHHRIEPLCHLWYHCRHSC